MRVETATGRESAQLAIQLAAYSLFLLGTAAAVCMRDRPLGKMGSELSAYLKDYLSLADRHTLTASGICSMSAAYVCSPLFALLCGFSWVGIGLLPIGALLTGFFPGYAAGCLFAAFSGQGLLLALGLFGLRCFVTVTCFFLRPFRRGSPQ